VSTTVAERHQAEARGPGFLSKTIALIGKDLAVELRGRSTFPPMIAFSLAVILLLAFTLPAGGSLRRPASLPFGTAPVADVVAGFLWITILFAGIVGFARTFEVEREERALDPLLLVPVDRSALFVAKAAANLVFITLLQVVVISLFLLLFQVDLGARALVLVLVVVVADIGFVAAGTLFASLAAQTTSRELILPIVALPALVPLFIGAVDLTAELFMGATLRDLTDSGWFGILLAFDLLFGVGGAIAFEFAVDG